MTMSISSAPSSRAARASATLTAVGYWPDGKPVATAATFTPLPASRSRTTGTRFGYTQTAATGGTLGSLGSGRRAFEAGQIRAADREQQRPDLGLPLDRAPGERGSPFLESDRVDRPEPRQTG